MCTSRDANQTANARRYIIACWGYDMRLRSLIEASVGILLAVASVSAQSASAPSAGAVPRAKDGHPDLSGVWNNATRTPFERPAVFEGRAPGVNRRRGLQRPLLRQRT